MLPGRTQNYHHVTLANGEIIENIYQPQIFHAGHETEFGIIVKNKYINCHYDNEILLAYQ